MNEQEKEILALEEVKNLFNQSFRSNGILDDKATSLLSSSSLILTLFSVLQITLIDDQSSAYIGGLTIVFFLYLALVLDILWIIWPRAIAVLFEITWESVNEVILNSAIPIRQLIANYFKLIERNRLVNNRKGRGLNIAIILFIAIMVTLLFLSLFTTR